MDRLAFVNVGSVVVWIVIAVGIARRDRVPSPGTPP
jgi:hypothetical protein